jgi:mRNA-degrading endonuclease RelE of RelBE toxin-antitoxin system
VQPTIPTRNRKALRPNDLSEWQLRIGRYRVFYDVDAASNQVTVKAIGWKEHNRLIVRGKETTL